MLAIELGAIVICVLVSGFFAGIETGMISVHRLRLRHHVEQDEPWALRIQAFLDQPDRLLGTTLVGTNLFMIAGSILAANVGHVLSGHSGEVVAGALMTAAFLLLSEYLPKAWFQSAPIRRCRKFMGLLGLSAKVFLPVRTVLTRMTDWVLRLPQADGAARPVSVTKDELVILARESEKYGVLSAKQRIMIHRVVELAERTAAECMVPRAQMVEIESGATVHEFCRRGLERETTRMPVWDAGQGRFVGIVNLFDVLPAEDPSSAAPVARFMRPPLVLRDDTPLVEVFPRMRAARQSVALLTSVKGEVVGMTTAEDVLRQIVGRS